MAMRKRKPAPSKPRSAAEIRAADKLAAARKFRLVHVPTPALKAAIASEKRGEFVEVDWDAFAREMGWRN